MSIPKQGKVIAIDGPAGTGKSSATKRLAETLQFIHVDTGALYRSIALLCLDQGHDFSASEASPQMIDHATTVAREAHFEFKRSLNKNPKNRIWMNGWDVTDKIRTPQISMAASKVSAVPGVRSALLALQRQLGCAGNSILEGRDIGTVIFPDADLKFYLVASVDERAKRRLAELEAMGADTPSFEEVRGQLLARDHGDINRAVAPLKKASDAIEIDTTQLTLDQVVKQMEGYARQRFGL